MRQWQGEVAILGVAGRGEIDAMRAFVDRHDLGAMTQIADLDGAVWSRFGVGAQPTWVFVTAEGEVERHFGPLSDDALRSRLEALGSG